ncbi:outer membrane beta-barrel protein [Hymenobacter oligotrophus]|uniref:outer membrane beta-barrel protein n=1 Tax=Hymenobacter oligotrophus TaxID=2319843 RepID=UPI0013C36BFD|nr:outer membrane beta-barrel protein [Hymenobacter oligotrophus]
MRITNLLLGAALLAPLAASAQAPRRHFDAQGRAFFRGPLRLSAGGGIALYNGDLTASLGDNFIGPAGQLGLVYTWRPHWSVGGEATAFQIGARDQLPERNLAFRGRNLAVTAFVRYEPLRDPSWYAGTRNRFARVKPFLKAGVGYLLYNPKAYNGTERPANNTEFLPAERPDYTATAITVPVGGGLSFFLTRRFWLTAEGAYGLTTTDHLDDVSQRGNPDRNDGYGTVTFKLEYQLGE